MAEPRARIVIAVPSHESVPALFSIDLAGLAMYTTAALPDDVEFGIETVTGTYIHCARQQLMEACLEKRATHILWIDSDMRFPREALAWLLEHDLPVVGINYSKRGFRQGFTALKRVGRAEDGGEQLRTTEESAGLEEVEAIGFGCVLMKTSALRDLPDPAVTPWFQNVWLEEQRQWMGEDVFFCGLLKGTGQRIFVDHDLSKACSHVGQHEFAVGTA